MFHGCVRVYIFIDFVVCTAFLCTRLRVWEMNQIFLKIETEGIVLLYMLSWSYGELFNWYP